MSGIIRCKHCGFTTPVWRTTKKGQKITGWYAMADHVMLEHPQYEDEAMSLLCDLNPDAIIEEV